MSRRIDHYPTRSGMQSQFLPRREAVFYGSERGPLNKHQCRAFDEKGYLLIEDFLDAGEVETCHKALDGLRQSEAIRQADFTITEADGGDIRSVFMAHTVEPYFAALSRDPRLVRIARQLLGSDVYIHQSRINFKPGFEGREFYWHSDFETWHAEDGMPGMRCVSFSITLTDNTPYNGALMLMPGSQRRFVVCEGETPEGHFQDSLKQQRLGTPDKERLRELAEDHGIEMPLGKAGSLLIFDCNTMHGSNSNISPSPRSNLFLVYNSVHNKLEAPFAAPSPRPSFLASHDFRPIGLEEEIASKRL